MHPSARNVRKVSVPRMLFFLGGISVNKDYRLLQAGDHELVVGSIIFYLSLAYLFLDWGLCTLQIIDKAYMLFRIGMNDTMA